MTHQEILDAIKSMTLLEIKELVDAGSEKIKVIKAVREYVAGLGLKEAKEFVEAVPKAIKEGVSKEEAEKVKAAFAEIGAKVEIK